MELPGRSDWGQPPEQRVAGAAGAIHSPRDLMYANVEACRLGTMECLNPLRLGEEESPHLHLTLVKAKLTPAPTEWKPPCTNQDPFSSKGAALEGEATLTWRTSHTHKSLTQPGAAETVGNMQGCSANWKKPSGRMGVSEASFGYSQKRIRTERLRATIHY